MLGRLHMSVDEAIETYQHLVKEVFAKPKLMTSGNEKFSASNLEKVLKEIIKSKLGDENTKLMVSDNDQTTCKMYVLPLNVIILPCLLADLSVHATVSI